jgi:hypothetical protein
MEQQIKVIRECLERAKNCIALCGITEAQELFAKGLNALAQLEQPKVNSFDVYKREMAIRENALIDEAENLWGEQPVNSGSEGLIKEIEEASAKLKDEAVCKFDNRLANEFYNRFPFIWGVIRTLDKCKTALSQVKPSATEVNELQLYKQIVEQLNDRVIPNWHGNILNIDAGSASIVDRGLEEIEVLLQALTTNGTKHE